ncbi:putative LPS assembly protein LptD [Hugenholtzia roseola]|uniref:putative LPS assembly protein LptD n=1 Tax=Hugenholtzia roseola TaxID=1002 RepID=UPI0012B63E81|nr:putative LPS assembly protein LptD [Hugenholtzia roseola]
MTLLRSLCRLISFFLFGAILFGLGIFPSANSTLHAQITKDSLQTKADTLAIPMSNDFASEVVYSATDSIVYDMEKGIIRLYRGSKIDFENTKLESHQIDIDWASNTLTAKGERNDSTGALTNTPVFKQGEDQYKAQEMRYNFKSERAIVTSVTKQEGEGFLLLERGKRDAQGNLSGLSGAYTTCNLDHPHFRIRSKKMKVIGKNQIVSGPFLLEISDIPTPLGFPFALMPIPKKRASGIIVPTYGETRERGFFLRDGGYYWAISDYIDLALLAEVYTKGFYGASLRSNYRKRYKYNGNFSFNINNSIQGERGTGTEGRTRDFKLIWSHTPQTKGSTRFSANVNAGTTTFDRRNAFNTQDFMQSSLNSSVNFSKTFEGTPFAFTSSLRHNQNVQTNIVTLSPQFNLSATRIFPFKNLVKNSRSPLAQIGINYNLDGRGDISNLIPAPNFGGLKTDVGRNTADTLGFNFSTASEMLKNMRVGFQHRLPLSTSLTLAKYITLSPSVNFTQTFYRTRNNYEWIGGDTVRVSQENGFFQFFRYDVTASLATRLYNTFYYKSEKFKALRHMMVPSVTFSYNPDFGDARYGFYQNVQTNNNGDIRRISRYEGIYGSPAQGRAGTIGIGFSNNLEAKVQRGDKEEKIMLIENLGFQTSYNLAADSFQLAPISVDFRTRVWDNKININARGTLDPYAYSLISRDTLTGAVSQRRLPTYALSEEGKLGRFSSLNVSISTNLNPDAFKSKEQEAAEKTAQTNEERQFIADNAHLYVDFNVPWSLNISYNLAYTRNGFEDPRVTQNVRLNGDVKLTEKWKVSYETSYDFTAKEFSFTSFNIHRDLHCWQLSATWVPFGPRQMYSVNLGVKASVLQDLKLNRQYTWRDRR